MNFHYIYDENPDYILATPVGQPETSEELAKHATEMFHLAAKSKSKCVLIDRHEGSGISFDTLDLVQVSQLLDNQGLQHLGVRAAVLINCENAKEFSALETSMAIRSFSYRIFNDCDKAVSWLKGDSRQDTPEK